MRLYVPFIVLALMTTAFIPVSSSESECVYSPTGGVAPVCVEPPCSNHPSVRDLIIWRQECCKIHPHEPSAYDDYESNPTNIVDCLQGDLFEAAGYGLAVSVPSFPISDVYAHAHASTWLQSDSATTLARSLTLGPVTIDSRTLHGRADTYRTGETTAFGYGSVDELSITAFGVNIQAVGLSAESRLMQHGFDGDSTIAHLEVNSIIVPVATAPNTVFTFDPLSACGGAPLVRIVLHETINEALAPHSPYEGAHHRVALHVTITDRLTCGTLVEVFAGGAMTGANAP